MPAITLCEAGVAEIVKSGAGLTIKVTVAVCVNVPLVPVTVITFVPTGVEPLVVTLKIAEPELVILPGLKVPVAPAGNPLTLKATLPVNPFNAPMVAV